MTKPIDVPNTLTLEAARSLEAGPETDALIAAMCGEQVVDTNGSDDWFTEQVACLTGRVCCVLENELGEVYLEWYYQIDGKWFAGHSDEHEDWSPSTDANAAIEAAEAVSLIDGWKCIAKADGAWQHYDDGKVSAEAPTFPLAICRAIAVRHVQDRDRKANAKVVAGDLP